MIDDARVDEREEINRGIMYKMSNFDGGIFDKHKGKFVKSDEPTFPRRQPCKE